MSNEAERPKIAEDLMSLDEILSAANDLTSIARLAESRIGELVMFNEARGESYLDDRNLAKTYDVSSILRAVSLLAARIKKHYEEYTP